MVETVKKETLLEKPVEAWYKCKVERMMSAREQNKEIIAELLLGEIQVGLGDLTNVEWEQKV